MEAFSVLEREILLRKILNIRGGVTSYKDFIERILSKLSLSEEFKKRVLKRGWNPEGYLNLLRNTVKKIEKEVDSKGLHIPHDPYSFATALIYAAERYMTDMLDKNPVITQELLAQEAGVSKSTLRNIYHSKLAGIIKVYGAPAGIRTRVPGLESPCPIR